MKKEKKVFKPYPKKIISMTFAHESARRNIEIEGWYKKIINGIFMGLIASIGFTSIAVVLAVRQPLAELYGSGLEGGLKKIKYIRQINDKDLKELRLELNSEEFSRQQVLELIKNKISSQNDNTQKVDQPNAGNSIIKENNQGNSNSNFNQPVAQPVTNESKKS